MSISGSPHTNHARSLRARIAAALALLFAVFSSAPGASAAVLAGAGDSEHAWILVIPDPEADGADAPTRLHHAPGDAAQGSVIPVQTFRQAPSHIAAGAGRLLLVFEPDRTSETESHVRLVRTLRVGAVVAPGAYQYEPRGRLAALPPLPGAGRLKGVVQTRTGVAALIRGLDAGGAGQRDRLLWSDGVEWREEPLPRGLDPDSSWTLLPHAGAFAVLERSRDRPSTLWTAASAPTMRPLDHVASGTEPEADAAGHLLDTTWTPSTVALDLDDETILPIGGAIIVVRDAGPNEVVLELVRDGRRGELTRLTEVGPVRTAVVLGEDVMLVWIDPENTDDPLIGSLHAAVVSSVTGQTLHFGPVVREPPVTLRDLTFLALLLSAVVLTVLIFVLRPEAAMRVAIVLPQGTSLAEPWVRVLAAVIDFAPCVLIAARLWGLAPAEVLLQPFGEVGEVGLLPLFSALALMFAHSAISEWLWGRTLGKALLRCRTVSVTGARLTLWQATARNVIKILAPPLILLILLDPRRRHLGDMVTGSLVVTRTHEPESDADKGASGPRASDPDRDADRSDHPG